MHTVAAGKAPEPLEATLYCTGHRIDPTVSVYISIIVGPHMNSTTVAPPLSKFFSYAAGVHPVGPICRALDDGAVRRVAQAPTSGTGQFGREGVHRAPSKQAHLPAQVGRTRVERTGRQFKPSAELLKIGTSDGRVTWRLAQSCMWCS